MITASFAATAATARRRPGGRPTYSHNTADQRGQCSRKGKQGRVGRKIYLVAHKQELTRKRLTSGECTQSIAKDFANHPRRAHELGAKSVATHQVSSPKIDPAMRVTLVSVRPKAVGIP